MYSHQGQVEIRLWRKIYFQVNFQMILFWYPLDKNKNITIVYSHQISLIKLLFIYFIFYYLSYCIFPHAVIQKFLTNLNKIVKSWGNTNLNYTNFLPIHNIISSNTEERFLFYTKQFQAIVYLLKLWKKIIYIIIENLNQFSFILLNIINTKTNWKIHIKTF